MWQQAIDPLVRAGKLTAIGVVQEQHPDRTRLYRQWRQLQWPILVDSMNLLGLKVVPVPVLVDESGVVQGRPRSPQELQPFLARPPAGGGWEAAAPPKPDPKHRRFRNDPVAHFLAGDLDRAVSLAHTATRTARSDAAAWFRYGVALRTRADRATHETGDGQQAVAAWGNALALDPNQYIWRRRIQQYGPRLDKPYNFYFWVQQARTEIRARGETPVPLTAEPRGSEVAPPARGAAPAAPTLLDPDPGAKIHRDTGRVAAETLVTPARVRPGRRVRVRVTLRLRPDPRPWWNNEADGLQLSVRLPAGWSCAEGTFDFPLPKEPETREDRVLEFELQVPANAGAGAVKLPVYLLYDVCDDAEGVCLRLRQDVPLQVDVDPAAPALGK